MHGTFSTVQNTVGKGEEQWRTVENSGEQWKTLENIRESQPRQAFKKVEQKYGVPGHITAMVRTSELNPAPCHGQHVWVRARQARSSSSLAASMVACHSLIRKPHQRAYRMWEFVKNRGRYGDNENHGKSRHPLGLTEEA